MEQLSIGSGMLLLLLFEALDPLLPCLLLACQHVLQRLDLLLELLFGDLKLPFDGSLLNLDVLISTFKFNDTLVKVFDFLSALVELLIFISYHVLERATSLLLLGQLQFGLVADFVSQVQLFDGVIEVELALVVLFPDFLMLYGECAVLEVDLVELGLHLLQLSFQLLDAFLPLLLDLAKADYLALGLLCLELYLVHLRDQGGAFLLVDLLQLLGLFELQLQVLLLVLQTGDLRFEHVDLQPVLGQVLHELLQLVLGHVQLVLGTRELTLEVLHLFDLDVDLSLEARDLLVVVTDFTLHFCLNGFELRDLVGLGAILVIELLVDGLQAGQFREGTLIFGLEVSVHRVHVVELGLELETQLHLLLVILSVLHVLFLKLEPHLSLGVFLLLKVIRVLLQDL